MKNKDVPFTQVRKMLEGVGLRLIRVRGVNHIFADGQERHFVVPVKSRKVQAIFVAGLAHILDETGALDRESFADRLEAANGHVHS